MADPFILTSDDVKRLRIALEHRSAFKAQFPDTNSSPPVSGITQLTGDVTAGPGSGSQAATIAPAAVTYAKIQNETDGTLLGRSAGSNGSPMEISIGSGMTLSSGTLNSVGGGSSAGTLWRFKAKTSATSGYPGDGYLLWDNATQTSATHLLFAHLTTDDLDVDLVLAQITSGKKLILQDSDVSGNFQEWSVTGSGVNTNPNTPTSYWTFPVTLIASGGTGTTGFSNNHQLVVFVVGAGATGTVTSVDVSGGTTGLTTSGGPVTTSGTITIAGTLAIANGGTGAITAGGARTNLGLGTMAVQDAGGVIITGGTVDTLSSLSVLDNDASDALFFATGNLTAPHTLTFQLNDTDRTLTIGASASVSGTNTGDQTLYNQTVEDEGTPLTQRGTINFVGAGVTAADSGGKTVVTIPGGSGGTVTSVDVSGGTTGLTTSGGPVTGSGTITIAGTLAVANGGTGATTAINARSNLGLVIGTNVEAWDADLDAIAALVPVQGDIMYYNGAAWSRLALGSTSKVLQSNGTDAVYGSVSIGAITDEILARLNLTIM